MIVLHKAIGTITTTLFTTVTTLQQIPSGEDHQSVFEVIVLALFERFLLVTLVATRNHFVLSVPFCG